MHIHISMRRQEERACESEILFVSQSKSFVLPLHIHEPVTCGSPAVRREGFFMLVAVHDIHADVYHRVGLLGS